MQNNISKIELMLFFIAIAAALTGLYYLGPSITGFVIKESSYTEDLNLVVTSSGNYTLQLENAGELKSVKIDGRVTNHGKARVYLESNGVRHLIFDSARMEQSKSVSNGSNLITAFVVKNEGKDDENKNETDEGKNKNNKKPKWSGDSEFIINSTTAINLSQYFVDEDGAALIYSADKIEGIEVLISGDLATITPKLGGNFNTTTTFTASDGLDIKSHTVRLLIIIEKDIAEKEQTAPNRAPIWNSNIEAFVINSTAIINLSEYFFDEDNDNLTYSSGLAENMTIGINGELLAFSLSDGYFGNASTSFTAYDGKNLTIKNVNLIVPEKIAANFTEPISNVNETINATNSTPEIMPINKTITMSMSYKSGTIYDANDNGEESLSGVVDLSVEGVKFGWNVDVSKLCTRWEIYNIEEISLTKFCNGNDDCCAFFDLAPKSANWNETYYSVFNKDGAGHDNIISAQVVYYDVNLSIDALRSEIYYSNWNNLSVKFFEDETQFFDMCLDTCALKGLNKSRYTLIFEIENDAVLRINKIMYNLLIDVVNAPPVLLRNFTAINVPKNGNATLNLSQYFADPDGDFLTYDYYKASDISILFDRDIATIMPDKGAEGARFTYLAANDSESYIISNLFIINISAESEPINLNPNGAFEIRDKDNNKLAVIDLLGNLNIKGVLIQNAEPLADSDGFALQNSSGGLNLIVTNPEGNMLIKGILSENQSKIAPTPNSFIIQSIVEENLAYVNSTGSLFLKGILKENVLFR